MWSLCALAILLQGCLSQNQKLTGPIVDTPLGKVVGWERASRDGRVYQAWTRIPYAQPPLGENRFMPPKPVEKWTGVLNATSDLSPCFQPGMGPGKIASGSEDCLYLNVYRPKHITRSLPVLFSIHGGAFQGGDIGPREMADYLMDQDVLLVALHYRVNFFGFMTLGDKFFPGNFGLKDQVTALRWVQKNIEAFGGDPTSVTAFGQSSGAQNSQQLLRSPLVESEDLVSRAVCDSGTINHVSSLMNVDEVKENTLKIVRAVGCDRASSEEIRKCLQKADGTAIMKAYIDNKPIDMSILPFAPVIEPKDAEDNVIPEDLSLRASTKPWITSTANGEYTLYLMMSSMGVPPAWFENTRSNLTGYLESWIGRHTNDSVVKREGAQVLKNYYFQVVEPMKNFTRDMAMLHSDDGFIYPFLYNIEKQKNVGPTWAFRNEYKGELSGISPFGQVVCVDDVAGHAETMNYYYNIRSTHPTASPIETPADKAVSKRLIKYLVNFAYYSNPTPPGSPFIWEQYKGNEIMRLTKNGDYMADANYVDKLKTILNVWSYVIGWK